MSIWVGTKKTARDLRELAAILGVSEDEALIIALDRALADHRSQSLVAPDVSETPLREAEHAG